jgi:hypothetical protein
MGLHLDERKVHHLPPSSGERYAHLKENAEAFVETMRTMVAACERDGNEDLATKLRVWCLMPWEAALSADASGELWPLCEVCGQPIKAEADHLSSDDGCDLHRSCVGR